MNDDDKNAIDMLSRGGELFFVGRDHLVARLAHLASLESAQRIDAASDAVVDAAAQGLAARVAELEAERDALHAALAWFAGKDATVTLDKSLLVSTHPGGAKTLRDFRVETDGTGASVAAALVKTHKEFSNG